MTNEELQKRAERYNHFNVPKEMHIYGEQIYRDAFREGEIEGERKANWSAVMLFLGGVVGGLVVARILLEILK